MLFPNPSDKERFSVLSFYKDSSQFSSMPVTTRRRSLAVAVASEKEGEMSEKSKKALTTKPLTEKSQNFQASPRKSTRRKSGVALRSPRIKIKKMEASSEDEDENVRDVKEEMVSDDEDEELSYEQMRRKNIEENAKFLASLGIFKAKTELDSLNEVKTKPASRGLKSEKKKKEVLTPRPRSLRLQGKTPEGEQLPDLPRRPVFFTYEANIETHGRPRYRFSAPRHPSKGLPGPSVLEVSKTWDRLPDKVEMKAMNVKREGREEEGDTFVESMKCLEFESEVEDTSFEYESLLKRLQKLKMSPTTVAKVVPNRVFSLAVHPTRSKTLIAAGGKWGRLGFWDVDSTSGDDGVFLFEPHARPINCLRFCAACPAKVFTSAYDGTLRRGDFEKGYFEEIYTTPEEDDILIHSFDFLSSSGDEILTTHGDGTGYVTIVDTRVSSVVEEPELYRLHKKNIRTVSVHPQNKNYFVTASVDGRAALWDIRKLKKGGNTSISEMPHGKIVSSAYFSPVTGNRILTTSSDDKLRIFEVEASGDTIKTAQLSVSKYHNNNTGRWLTKFRAEWHPQSDEIFVVGSMQRPRKIEVFNHKCSLLHEFVDEEWLGSVCSLNSFHPTNDVIVGANSSGRLHLFR